MSSRDGSNEAMYQPSRPFISAYGSTLRSEIVSSFGCQYSSSIRLRDSIARLTSRAMSESSAPVPPTSSPSRPISPSAALILSWAVCRWSERCVPRNSIAAISALASIGSSRAGRSNVSE